MNNGRLLAIVIAAATVVLVVVGTLWPIQSAVAMSTWGDASLLHSVFHAGSSGARIWRMTSAGTTGQELIPNWATRANSRSLNLSAICGETISACAHTATLDGFEVRPLHASADDAQMQLRLRWSTVVGTFLDTKDLRVIRNGDRWEPLWPLVKEPRVPPQVIRGELPALGCDLPRSRRMIGEPRTWKHRTCASSTCTLWNAVTECILMGELLNEDVVPAYVSVKATLLAKDGSPIATEDSFDKISHLLLPKQVTPFLISFHNLALSRGEQRSHGAFVLPGCGFGRSHHRDSGSEIESRRRMPRLPGNWSIKAARW